MLGALFELESPYEWFMHPMLVFLGPTNKRTLPSNVMYMATLVVMIAYLKKIHVTTRLNFVHTHHSKSSRCTL